MVSNLRRAIPWEPVGKIAKKSSRSSSRRAIRQQSKTITTDWNPTQIAIIPVVFDLDKIKSDRRRENVQRQHVFS